MLAGALIFLGLGGLYGGIAMLSDTSGGALGMDEVLPLLPVRDYLLPGLFLLVGMGLVPLVLTWGLLTRAAWGLAARTTSWTGRHWAWSGVVALALVLGVFLGVQAAYIGFMAPIQGVTAANGMLIFGLASARRVRRWCRI